MSHGEWSVVRLGDIATLIAGSTPRGLSDCLIEGCGQTGAVPFFKVGDMNLDPNVLGEARVSLPSEDAVRLNMRIVPKGAVVFPKTGGAIATNKKRVVVTPGAIDLNCMAAVAGSAVDSRYLRLWFESLDLSKLSDGSVLPQLSKKTMAGLSVPLPSLTEQRLIVEILEDHLSRLEAGADALRRLPTRLRALQRALIDKVFMAEADAGGWPIVPLEQCASDEPRSITDGPFGSNLTSGHYVPSGVRVVRLQNIGDGVFKRAAAFISEDHFQSLRSHEVREGDLVVASLGEDLPRAAVVPELGGSAIVKADCVRVRLRHEIDPAWVALACRSTRIKSWARARVHGVGRQRLGVAGIKEIRIPLPGEELRRATLGELTQALEDVDRLRMSVALGSARLAALRRSVLDAAFSGRLTGSSADFAEESCGI